MIQKSILFKKGDCRISLNIPDALEYMPVKNVKKFCKDMISEVENDESFREFFSYIPEIEEKLKQEWDEASLKYQREYRLPDNGRDKLERDKIRTKNKRLLDKVKAAKARYERFEKRIPLLNELKEQYVLM